jgi:cobalamin biosynthetic protein CobC
MVLGRRTHVVPAPGTQILLPLVAGLVRSCRAAIVAPTYAEHARAAAFAGHEVEAVRGIDACGDAGLVIVGNPNNPDGRLYARKALLASPRACAAAAACSSSTRRSWMSGRPA